MDFYVALSGVSRGRRGRTPVGVSVAPRDSLGETPTGVRTLHPHAAARCVTNVRL